ncbi:MAG: hypothetical protein CMF34_02000 [Leeuwenhoekiella sp.]|nr:hypothetical protein [Leeuwenhoekiella sp.]
MPHVWNDILVVTKEELVPDFFTAGNLSKTCKRYENKSYGLNRVQLGGNGRQLLIEFDSLPKDIQKKIGDPRKSDHILEKYYKIDPEATAFYTNYQFEDGEYLTLDSQDKHITNASILQAVLKLEIDRRTERLNKGGSMRGLNTSLWQDAVSFIELKEQKNPETFQCTLPRSERRFIERALRPFKKEGYAGIIKKYKANDNARKVTSKEEKLLNDLFSTQPHKPTATEIARQYDAFLAGYLEIVNSKTGELYNPKGYAQVSPSTITNYLTKWENEIGNHAARSGDRQKLLTKFSPYHSFERPEFAGSLLSIDDRQPPFEYAKGKRMWFYNGIDLASEAFTCFVYGKSKEGIILDFYRQMVRNYHAWGFNLPDGLECESSLNSSFKDTFLREGAMFQDVRIESNKARSKKIERYFGELRYGLEKQREGWLARPFAISESNQQGAESKITIPYDQLVQDCLLDIQTWNNMPHSQNKNMTRWEYFCEKQNENLKPTNYKAILPHLGFETVSSCNASIIKLQYGEFLLGDNGSIFTGESLIRLMKRVEGQEIKIYWLDDHEDKVFKALVYINGQYICEALPKPRPNRAKIERTPEDDKQMQLMSSYAMTIDQYQRAQKNALEPVTVINHKPKTLNNKFQIPGLNQNTVKPNPKPVEVLDDYEEEFNYKPQENKGGSWRSAFNN